MRSLIIDDSRVIRMVLRRILDQLGFDGIHEAGDGQEAIELLGSGRPGLDVVFVDWHMPRMNGHDFIHGFRRMSEYAEVPVIVISGDADALAAEEVLGIGADGLIHKPITVELVSSRLTAVGVIAPG